MIYYTSYNTLFLKIKPQSNKIIKADWSYGLNVYSSLVLNNDFIQVNKRALCAWSFLEKKIYFEWLNVNKRIFIYLFIKRVKRPN